MRFVSCNLPSAIVAALITGCVGQAPRDLAIYASLPLTGPASARAQPMVEGFRAALAQHDYSVCASAYRLQFLPLDHTTEGVWDATLETAAANKAATDPSAVAFLGSFEPAPLLLSLPILNKAGPMLVVAPMNTYGNFTRPRGPADEPEPYYPSGTRSFVRLGPTDEQIGQAAAHWAARAGAGRVYVVYDLYDPTLQGLAVARAFEQAALEAGLEIIGAIGVDRFAGEYDSVMDQIGRAPDDRGRRGVPLAHLLFRPAGRSPACAVRGETVLVGLSGAGADTECARICGRRVRSGSRRRRGGKLRAVASAAARRVDAGRA